MYDFHYNLIKKVLNCYLPTHSFTYEIKSEDVYEEFFKRKYLFDLSNYPKDSSFFDPVNENFIGKMKDVSEGKMSDEFVGLKSKMHSMKNIDGKETFVAKGVNIATEFNESKGTLFNKNVVRHKMKTIQSKKHKIGTYEVKKNHYHILMIKCFF